MKKSEKKAGAPWSSHPSSYSTPPRPWCSLAGPHGFGPAESGRLRLGHLQLDLQGAGLAQTPTAAGSTGRSRLPRLHWGQ